MEYRVWVLASQFDVGTACLLLRGANECSILGLHKHTFGTGEVGGVTLSKRQLEILEAIRRLTRENGYPPTVREIGAVVGLSSPASVLGHLRTLERQGCIRRDVLKRRALELVEDGAGGGVVRLPLVGRVAAGAPILADEHVEDVVEVPSCLLSSGECFVLRVKGSSMVKAGILDGDLLVVRRQDSAENGDIVVAILGDEATVKRFYREADHIRLQPENDDMPPLLVRDPLIAGKVVGVMRRVG